MRRVLALLITLVLTPAATSALDYSPLTAAGVSGPDLVNNLNEFFGGQSAMMPNIACFPYALLPAVVVDHQVITCRGCARTNPCTAGTENLAAIGTETNAGLQWNCDWGGDTAAIAAQLAAIQQALGVPTITPTLGAGINSPTRTRTPTPSNTATYTATSAPGTATPTPGTCGAATFTSLVNMTASGSSVQKTGGASAWDAGANTVAQVVPGVESAIQWLVDSSSDHKFVGLTRGETGPGFTDFAWGILNYAGDLQAWEDGAQRQHLGTAAVGDMLRVHVAANNIVTYEIQHPAGSAWVQMGAPSVSPLSAPAWGDISVYDPNAWVRNVSVGTGNCSAVATPVPYTPTWTHTPSMTPGTPVATPTGAACAAVTWTNTRNATATGSTLTKTGGLSPGWDAGANSLATLASGYGQVQVSTANDTDVWIFGLSTTEVSPGYLDCKWCILQNTSTLQIWESGVQQASVGGFTPGDLLRVRVGADGGDSAGTVYYEKAPSTGSPWTLLRKSSVLSTTYPIFVDVSIAILGTSITNAFFGSGTCPVP